MEGINHHPEPALRSPLIPCMAEPSHSGPCSPVSCLSFPTWLGAAGRVVQICAHHPGSTLEAHCQAPLRVPAASVWPGMTLPGSLCGLMGREKQGSSSGDWRCWHPHPALSSFPCMPGRLLDPTVLWEGSSDLWRHKSPGSIKMGMSPAHLMATPGSRVVRQQHPPGTGDHTASQPDLTSSRVALALGWT